MAKGSEPSRLERNIEFVEQMYRFVNNGQFSEFMDRMADGVIAEEPASHPYPGRFVGKQAVEEASEKVFASLNVQSIDVVDCLASENRVSGILTLTALNKAGESFEIRCCEVWEIDDGGKVAKVTPYYLDMYDVRAQLGLGDPD